MSFWTLGANQDFQAADGTAPQTWQTLARDRNIIPGRNSVYVDLGDWGDHWFANDKGAASKIVNWRFDLFLGDAHGPDCQQFENPMAIGTCSGVGTGVCPGPIPSTPPRPLPSARSNMEAK
jgi:3D (Asp-Asp-Asp) domain-containing protein